MTLSALVRPLLYVLVGILLTEMFHWTEFSSTLFSSARSGEIIPAHLIHGSNDSRVYLSPSSTTTKTTTGTSSASAAASPSSSSSSYSFPSGDHESDLIANWYAPCIGIIRQHGISAYTHGFKDYSFLVDYQKPHYVDECYYHPGRVVTGESMTTRMRELWQRFSKFSQKLSIKPMLGGGALIGWWWWKQPFPTDPDIDVFMAWDDYIQLVSFDNELSPKAYLEYVKRKKPHLLKNDRDAYMVKPTNSTSSNTTDKATVPPSASPVSEIPPMDEDFPFVFRRQPFSRTYWRRYDAHGFVDARIIDPLTGIYIDIFLLSNAEISEDEIPFLTTDLAARQRTKMEENSSHREAVEALKNRYYEAGLSPQYKWTEDEILTLSLSLERINRTKAVDAWLTDWIYPLRQSTFADAITYVPAIPESVIESRYFGKLGVKDGAGGLEFWSKAWPGVTWDDEKQEPIIPDQYPRFPFTRGKL